MKAAALALAAAMLMAGCKRSKCPEASACEGGSGGETGKPAAAVPSPWQIPQQYTGTFQDYRKTWTSLTGFEFSGLHWNQYISLYVNKDPERYVRNYLEYVRLYVDQDIDEEEVEDSEKRFEPYPEGTIFLKENFLANNAKPGNPLTVTAMIKREKGYDPGSNDWQFLQWDKDGKILFDGNSSDPVLKNMCIKCHANMAERDFVFSTFCSIAPPPEK